MSKPSQFASLKEYELELGGVPYVIEQLRAKPTIWFRPGTNENVDFLNESLRRQREAAPKGETSAATIAAGSRVDKEVIAATCVVRWDVKNDKGEEVEPTYENVLEYFEALPDWIFRRMANWVTAAPNFCKADLLGEGSPRA